MGSARRLLVGRAYLWDGWLFAAVRERDEHSVDALCLTDFGWRSKAGEVVEVRHNSVVGLGALEVK